LLLGNHPRLLPLKPKLPFIGLPGGPVDPAKSNPIKMSCELIGLSDQ
jgi:hypothetical protein